MTAKFRIKSDVGYFLRWLDFAAPPEMTSDKAEARQLTGAEADFILLKMERMGFEGKKEMITQQRTTRKLPPDEDNS